MNYGGFTDKEIDELIDKQAQTLDKKQRERVVAEIERKLLEQVPCAVLFRTLALTGAWKEVKNFKPGFGSHSWGKLDHAWLEN